MHWKTCSPWSNRSDNHVQRIVICFVYHCSKKFRIHKSSLILLRIRSILLRAKLTYPEPSSFPDPDTFWGRTRWWVFFYSRINLLTVKLRNDPIKLPSSYLPSFPSVASRTETSLLIRPVVMLNKALSIWSSIFAWYWCLTKEKIKELIDLARECIL